MSIKEDQITGTEQAIDKLVEAIGERMPQRSLWRAWNETAN